MATEPALLLLDEPAAGMNPSETRDLQALIRRLREKHDLSNLLIEHDMKLVMSLSDRVCVLELRYADRPEHARGGEPGPRA
jgi:branched-chain amino acid transport system ATP-binding protein